MLQLQTEDASIQITSIKTYVILFRNEIINEKITSFILAVLIGTRTVLCIALRSRNKYKRTDVCIHLHTDIMYDIEISFADLEDCQKSP